MIDVNRLIADFEDCLDWPYASPGTNDERGIDCSGMFVRAYRLQGQRIYHGSNTIWRKYLGDKGPIDSVRDLRPGMAVFKWKPETPGKFSDGEGNFCHIGLVTSTNPLRIVHASTEGMKVRADTKIGKWKYWGVLAAADMDGAVDAPAASLPEETLPGQPAQPEDVLPDAPIATIDLLPVAHTLRPGDRGNDVKALQRALRYLGYELEIDGIFGRITRECVKSFQATRGLIRDGVVGWQTWPALKAACQEVDAR